MQSKIDYICLYINDISKKDKLKVAKILWEDNHSKNFIKEKGDGIQINCKYMSKQIITEIYQLVQTKIEESRQKLKDLDNL